MPAPKSKITNRYPLANELIPRMVELIGLDASKLRDQGNNKPRLFWSEHAPMGEATTLDACLELAELAVGSRGSRKLSAWHLEKGDERRLLALRLHRWIRGYEVFCEMLNAPDSAPRILRAAFVGAALTTLIELAVLANLCGQVVTLSPAKDRKQAARDLVAELKRLNPLFRRQSDRTLQRALAGDLMAINFCGELKKRLAHGGHRLPGEHYFEEVAAAQRFARSPCVREVAAFSPPGACQVSSGGNFSDRGVTSCASDYKSMRIVKIAPIKGKHSSTLHHPSSDSP